MTDFRKVEELLQLTNFFYDTCFVDGDLIRELARRSIQNFETRVNFLRNNNHICYVKNMNSFFKSFRGSTCDTTLSRTANLERNLITCSERVKHIQPKNIYQLRETLFDKLDSLNIPDRKDPKLFKSLAVLIAILFASKVRGIKEIKLQRQGKTCPFISLNFVKSNTRNHSSLQFRSLTLDTLYPLLPVPLKVWQRKAKHK